MSKPAQGQQPVSLLAVVNRCFDSDSRRGLWSTWSHLARCQARLWDLESSACVGVMKESWTATC